MGGSEEKVAVWPAARAPWRLYRSGVAAGWSDEDISAIMKVMEHLSGK